MLPILNYTVSIKRLAQSITSGKRSVSESTIASNVDCFLLRNDSDEGESPRGVAANDSWLGFFPAGSNLKSLDELTDGTTTWRIVDVRDFNLLGSPVRCTLEEKN